MFTRNETLKVNFYIAVSSTFRARRNLFFLRCVLQTVEIKKISAPYMVYRVPHSEVRLVFLHSLHRIKFTRVKV